MQPLDSSLSPNRKALAHTSHSRHRFNIALAVRVWSNGITRSWSIYQKIRVGYALSMSIAVLGTVLGLIVGEYYDDKAVQAFNIAQERYDLMDRLEKAVLELTFYQQQITSDAQNEVLNRQKITKLIESVNTTRIFIEKLKLNLKNKQVFPEGYAKNLKSWLYTYDAELKLYNLVVDELLHEIDTKNQTPENVQTAQQILGMTSNGEATPKFEQLSESLRELVKSTEAQQQQAKTTFRAAKVLRIIIIIASMALSMAIASSLALYISRAIARPIKAVTQVAKQATQEGNFDLQAPVTTDDEVGVLATSLNQLIQQVAAKIRELQQTQAQLIQSEKMSGLGQMVAGIAHEINNPVNFIYGNLDHVNAYMRALLELVNLYQQHYHQPLPEIQEKINDIEFNFICEDLPKILSSMHVGTERLRQIILSLRNFSRLDEAEMKQVDIHEGIDNTLLILNHRLNPDIKLIKQYQPLPLINCYPAQLNQVFMNIISNAVDELLEHQQLSLKQLIIQTQVVDSNQIQVRIRDNGPGIAPEIKDKIFDPFFTTKPVGQGTGMGLAIAYQIIEKHHGSIDVFSELGQGAEFIVTLPIQHR